MYYFLEILHFILYITQNKPKIYAVVKHVVKGEKWNCSPLQEEKNNPVLFTTKTRDFKKSSKKIKEKWRFG